MDKKIGKINLMAIGILVAFIISYTSPILLNLHKAFTLFPKNIPRYYDVYFGELFFRKSILEYHQFPQWSWNWEGGMNIFAFPGATYADPLSFIFLIFDEVTAYNLKWVLFYVLGALSMYYLSRFVLKHNVCGSIFASIVFSMSGYFAYLHEEGLCEVMLTLLLPLFFGFLFKAKTDKRYIIFSALTLGYISIQSVLFVPVIILFGGIFVLIDSIKFLYKKFIVEKAYLVRFIFICVLAFLFSCVKALPILLSFGLNVRPHELGYAEAITASNTFSSLFQRMLIPNNSGPGTMYLGYLPIIVSAFSSIFYFREIKNFILCLFLAIWISFGPNAFFDVNRILWYFPVFHEIQEIPKYYSLIIVFFISILSGRFFSFIERLKNKKLAYILSFILVAALFVNLLWSNIGYFNSFDTGLPLYGKKSNDNFKVMAFNVHPENESIAAGPLSYFLLQYNLGLLNPSNSIREKEIKAAPKYFLLPRYCFLSPYTSLLVLPNLFYKGEAFFLKKDSICKILKFSPNELVFEAMTNEPDILVINQNYDAGWKANFGKIIEYNGLLAINFDKAMTCRIRLAYFSTIFLIGLMISLASLVLAGVYIIRFTKSR